MSDKDFQIPESLKDALRSGLVVPFIGAGVSLAVKKKKEDGEKSEESLFPSWKGFVETLAEALKGETKFNEADYVLSSVNIKKPKYLEAMQHAREELGARLWYKVFEDNFDRSEDEADEDSLKLPKLIWKLGNNLIVTTNVDRVFQWTCPKLAEYRYLDVQNVEYARLQSEQTPKRPTVWHLHGHIDHKENVIFTFDQYRAFYEERNNEAKLQTLLNFLTDRTFLFIGFSLDDAYIREQLEYIHKIYKGGADSFYILLRESQIEKANLPGYITPVPFSDFGKPLEDLIEELSNIANGNSAPPKPPTEPINPKDALKNHFNVPFASKGEAFVGREGLREKIWQSLSKSGRAAIAQAVSIKGIGGLGKTQLAVEYAHAYRERYENGVFWLTADEDINIQLIKIGEDLNWISQFDTGFDQAELVRNRFRKLSGCLIIFDNVDERKAIENYLPESGARPHILITSRERQEFFDEINLDVLNRDESRKLLLEVSVRSLEDDASEDEREANEKAFEKILEELGDLPLAVELVGGFLAEHSIISFRQYLGFLDEVPLDALEEDFPSISFTHHDKSIIRTLKISEKVTTKKPYLEEILDILAWSGKSSMGYSLLQSLTGIENNYTLTTALSDLVNLRLIKEEKPAKRYAIHRLVARVRRFEKPLAERKQWQQKIVAKLVEWFRERKDEFEYLVEFENETIHLQQWQSQSVDVLPIETVYLTNFEAYPLWHRGNYQESKILLEKALNLYQENQLNDEKLLANLYNDLGVIAGSLGNINQKFEFYQKALSIGRSVFNDESEDIAKFLNNLGISHRDLGNHQKALELQEQALKMQQELFGEKHPAIALSLNNLGYTHYSLNNRQKAVSFYESALKMHRELLGEKHPDTILTCEDLIQTLSKLGKREQAGRLAGEFLSYVPQNHPRRWLFEEYGAAYRKARKQKKRHKK